MQPNWRATLAQALMVGAALLGATAMVVEPMREKLELAQRSLEGMIEDANGAGDIGAKVAHATELLRASEEDAARIREMSTVSGDPVVVYERLMALGASAGLTIEQMNPRRGGGTARQGEGATSMAYSISAIGDYAAVARYIRLVEREAGFSAVTAIDLRPVTVDGRQTMRATIETVHHRIDPDASLAAASPG